MGWGHCSHTQRNRAFHFAQSKTSFHFSIQLTGHEATREGLAANETTGTYRRYLADFVQTLVGVTATELGNLSHFLTDSRLATGVNILELISTVGYLAVLGLSSTTHPLHLAFFANRCTRITISPSTASSPSTVRGCRCIRLLPSAVSATRWMHRSPSCRASTGRAGKQPTRRLLNNLITTRKDCHRAVLLHGEFVFLDGC